MMQLRHFNDIPTYQEEVQPFLAEDEVANGMLLGMVMSTRPRQGVRHKPYLVYLEDNRGPLLAAAMLGPRRLLLSSHRAVPSSAFKLLARDLHQNGRRVPTVFGPADMSGAFAHSWATLTGFSLRPGLRQRLMELERVVFPPTLPGGRLRRAILDDGERISQWTVDFQAEALPEMETNAASAQAIANRLISGGDLFLWENGEPVSMAARARPTLQTIAINLVYTPPEQRGHGYASACVSCLSRQLLDGGFERCTLFTDSTNRTSNHIYQAIGYRPVMDYAEYDFTRRER
jgi:RimJ/RimL family protein N-acetyltransferase